MEPVAAELRITGIDFGPEAWLVGYVRIPQDIRKNGLQWSHQALVPIGSDYDDEMEEAKVALLALLEDVLDDQERAEPVEWLPTEDDTEDQDDDDD